MEDAQKVSPIEFVYARLYDDERELVKDPPVGLGYANLAARIRREITIKRAILAMAEEAAKDALEDVARVLAFAWNDHSDYDPEWKP